MSHQNESTPAPRGRPPTIQYATIRKRGEPNFPTPAPTAGKWALLTVCVLCSFIGGILSILIATVGIAETARSGSDFRTILFMLYVGFLNPLSRALLGIGLCTGILFARLPGTRINWLALVGMLTTTVVPIIIIFLALYLSFRMRPALMPLLPATLSVAGGILCLIALVQIRRSPIKTIGLAFAAVGLAIGMIDLCLLLLRT